MAMGRRILGIADTPYAETWIEHLKNCTRCEWCGRANAKRNRRGLCRHCDDVRKQVEKLQKLAKEELPSATGLTKYWIQRELAIAEAKRASCTVNGNIVKRILAGEADSLMLEHQLTRISKRMSGKDLFHGDATSLGWAFTKAQKQVLAYLLWEILSDHARKNRRTIAENIVFQKERAQEVAKQRTQS